MEYNVHNLSSQHDFVVAGVSYIGNPISHTAMYVSRKVENLLKNLNGVSHCLVFAENGLRVSSSLERNNCFIYSDSPQREYARFANMLYHNWFEMERKRKYMYTKEGYYLGENVKLGKNAYIEPGCFIGHDVIIGQDSCILAGAVIKKSIIGDGFLANECAVVGANGFTMTEDEDGNKFRIPTLGRVKIGNYVEIGTHNNISCGIGGNTVLEDFVKTAALVTIEHDVYLGRNTEIAAGTVVGGFTRTDSHVYLGLNSSVRNRIVLGENSVIGMGATVTKSVEANITVVGNPARLF